MKSILQNWYSLYALFILRRWKNKQESDSAGNYKVSHHYELVGGGYADLYWYVHDTKHSHDSPKHHRALTVYDRIHVSRVKSGIKRVEKGELRTVLNELLHPRSDIDNSVVICS